MSKDHAPVDPPGGDGRCRAALTCLQAMNWKAAKPSRLCPRLAWPGASHRGCEQTRLEEVQHAYPPDRRGDCARILHVDHHAGSIAGAYVTGTLHRGRVRPSTSTVGRGDAIEHSTASPGRDCGAGHGTCPDYETMDLPPPTMPRPSSPRQRTRQGITKRMRLMTAMSRLAG